MIKDSELNKLQKLVKINYSDDEKKVFLDKLSGVVQMIDQLQELDCTNIEPLRSVVQENQRMVEDKVSEKDISNDLFSGVPEQGKDLAKEVKCFVVPKVVE
ncbi:MAG: hypothetical protein DGJ47_001190 [Rickettsiaceae bacterium]